MERHKNRDRIRYFPSKQYISRGAVRTLNELHRIFNPPDG
jgi:hypothetical protein